MSTKVGSGPRVRTPRLDGEFVETLGGAVAGWMKKWLVFGPGDKQGQDFVLDDFQREFVDDLYRFDTRTGQRIVRRAVLGVAKGNAKSELEAAIDLCELWGPAVVTPSGDGRWVPARRASPDIPVAAASYEQADLVFGAARVMSEKFADRAPWIWFEEMNDQGHVWGEDTTFCLRVLQCGFPIYVHTGVEVGHMKPQKIDAKLHAEWKALKEGASVEVS